LVFWAGNDVNLYTLSSTYFLRISEIANWVFSEVLWVGDIYWRQEKWRMIVG